MLRLVGVAKSRRGPALEGVDLEVRAGEAVALTGPNGAGKTTLLRVAATLDRPTAGRVLVAGRDAREEGEAARAALGWCGDRPGLWGELTARENLAWAARLRGLPASAAEAAAARLGLAPVLDRRAAHLSRGWQQRAALARAVVGDPPLLLLDEPAAALDADGRARLEALLAERRAAGLATLAAVHGDARAWARREVRLEAGRIVADAEVAVP